MAARCGKLQVVNGELFYSPNDHRTLVSIPAEDPTGAETARVFLPTRREAATCSFAQRMEEVYTPRWWSLAWGWTAFIPLHPHYERGLKLLARDPTPYNYREKQGRYTMGTSTLQRYVNLEQDLYHITHHLSMQLQISVVKPSHPTVFGFRLDHTSHQDLIASARASREWFDVWVGLLCHLISETEEEQIRKRGFPTLAIMHWNDFLVKQGQSRTTVQELNAELVCSFHKSVQRVGTFLRLDNPKIHRMEAFIRRLQKLSVPVWYRWLPEYEKHRFFSNLGPASSQIQDLLASSIPQPLHYTESPVGPRSITSVVPQTVLDFFAAREREHTRLATIETAAQRIRRQQRMAHPPTASAVVWVWEQSLSGEWIRERVGQRERVNTLDDMKSYQKCYDPYFNEWNCCDALSRPQDYDPCSSDDDEDLTFSAVDSAQSTCALAPGAVDQEWASRIDQGTEAPVETPVGTLEIPLQPSAEQESFVLPIQDVDDLAAMQSGSSVALTTEIDTAEEYILQILRLFYGFTPPLPLPDLTGQDIPEKARTRFLKFVGIPLNRVNRDLFLRPSIKCAVFFMEKLGAGQAISTEEIDLDADHRESLLFNARLHKLQPISDVETGKTLYMFNFGSHSTVPWHIAVETAVHALAICRLPTQMEDRDIALYLVHHGIPFKTLQRSSTLPRMPLTITSSRIIPHRMQGHVFSRDDYTAHLVLVENILKNRRLSRAALMAGGYPWRLAMISLSPSVVLEGPTGWSTTREDMFVVRDKETGEEYIDDCMTELEGALLCGLVECFTGNGAQTSRKSYHPLPSTFRGSGMDYGRWTVLVENSFKMISEASSTGSRQPKTMTQWRDGTRGAGEFRRSQSRIEELSIAFIRQHRGQGSS